MNVRNIVPFEAEIAKAINNDRATCGTKVPP